MTPTMRTFTVILGLLALTGSTLSGQSLRRSAEGGPAEGGRRGGAVPVPRNPYHGSWDGELVTTSASEKSSIPITMSFTVVDERKQLYRGETIVSGSQRRAHLNAGATTATVELGGGGASIPRSAGPASETSGSGPLSPETIAANSGQQALLLYHFPSRTMLLCGLDHRCGDLPALRWEETDAEGKSWGFLAQLIAADTLSVVAIRRDTNASPETQRTFRLVRRK